MKDTYFYAIFMWFMFAILATLNGVIRNATYGKWLSELYAHQISTVIFIAILLVVMYLFFNKTKVYYTKRELWLIGFTWLVGTIVFEFIFGHYVFGNTWEKLFADYNLLKGRIWSFVLLVTLSGPWLVGKK